MAKTCKFYKLGQEVSYDCGETWQPTGQYDKGRLYEVNSRDCGFMLIYRWALSQGDYDCEGVKKYNMEVLQFTTEQGGEYQNVSPEYKRRTGDVAEWLSVDCGYVESTGGFKFSGTSEISCGHKGLSDENNPSELYRSEVSGITAPHSIVGDCTEIIGSYAFSGTNLQTIDISSYTTKIKDHAFQSCSGITNMTIPDTVEEVGAGLFMGCINLSGATLPSHLDYIPTETFHTTAVENYVVPNGIKLIGWSSFVGANGWWYDTGRTQDLNISLSNITDIGEEAFAGRNFNGTLSLPSSLKYIGNEAFRGSEINGGFVLPNGIEHVSELFGTDYRYCEGITGNVTIPGSLKYLRGGTYCSVEKVTINEGVEYVGGSVVNGVQDVLPSSVNFMLGCGWKPYYDNVKSRSRLTPGERRAPANVELVNQKFFCDETTIAFVVEAKTPPFIANFSEDPKRIYINPSVCRSYEKTKAIIVPDESLTLYKQMWSNWAEDIYPMSGYRKMTTSGTPYCFGRDKYVNVHVSVTPDDGVTWYEAYDDKDLYEKGSQDCPDTKFSGLYDDLNYYVYNLPCDSSGILTKNETNYNHSVLDKAYIGGCVGIIDREAFCQYSSMTSVEISSSVVEIRESAFTECTSLTDIDIPDSVTTIGIRTFAGCTSLTGVSIGTGLTTISSELFSGCTSLANITIPNNITTIVYGAFTDCSGLTSIAIPNSVTSIGGSVFNGCASLTGITVNGANTVYDSRNGCNAIIETSTNKLVVACNGTVIPNSVTSIGDGAFSRTSFTSITIPNSVTSIGDGAFSNCTSLQSINIPNSVTSIGVSAFQYCTGLTSVTIPDSVTLIDMSAFWGCSGLTSITCLATTPPTLGNDSVFEGSTCYIYVPEESVDAYQDTGWWWSYRTRIRPIS